MEEKKKGVELLFDWFEVKERKYGFSVRRNSLGDIYLVMFEKRKMKDGKLTRKRTIRIYSETFPLFKQKMGMIFDFIAMEEKKKK